MEYANLTKSLNLTNMDPLDIYPTTLRIQLKEACKQVHYQMIEAGLPDDGPANHSARLALHQLVVKALNHNLDYREANN